MWNSDVLFNVNIAGIAFPTCISVNNCICHFSPLKSEPDLEIKPGDIVKMYVYISMISIYFYFSLVFFVLIFLGIVILLQSVLRFSV